MYIRKIAQPTREEKLGILVDLLKNLKLSEEEVVSILYGIEDSCEKNPADVQTETVDTEPGKNGQDVV